MRGWLETVLSKAATAFRGAMARPFPVTAAAVDQVIPLDFPNTSGSPALFVGERQRLATATAVRFLDRHRLIAAHLAGQRLSLLERIEPEGAWRVTSSLQTTYLGRPVCTDVLDVAGNQLIVTSNCGANSISFYRLAGNRIVHQADIEPADEEQGFCHGAKFLPGGSVVCATCTTGRRNLYFFSVPEGKLIYKFNDGDWRPKDACFIDAGRMLVFFSRGNATRAAGKPFESKISCVDLDLAGKSHRVRFETFIDRCQFDCGTFRDGLVYMNNQMRDTVVVMAVKRDRLVQVREWGGFHFPHGLDVLPAERLMAVTNYGSSDIFLCRL